MEDVLVHICVYVLYIYIYMYTYIYIYVSQMEKRVAHPGTTFDGNVFLRKETCDSGREKFQNA
jgi:hypothetical protein